MLNSPAALGGIRRFRFPCSLLFKCAGSSQEVESLSSLLREAKAALGTAKSDLEATVDKHIRTLDAARKVGEH